MKDPVAPFAERYRRAVGDPQLARNLLAFQRAWNVTRAAVFAALAREGREVDAHATSFEAARVQLTRAKDEVLERPSVWRLEFSERARASGAVVHEASDADAARRLITELLVSRGVRLLAKGKSMAAEEIFLNHALQAAGIEVVETDLGEWIVQLAHEMPSHMVMPAIHKSRGQIADLFTRVTGEDVPRDDVAAQVAFARRRLREVFLTAGAGLIGANALIAETGTVMLVTNEGNGDLVSSLPPIVIVLAGWEKIVPRAADVVPQLRLLARSATGQEITSYTSFLTGPGSGRELHIVLLDNGRSAMRADPGVRDALRCIRCAACADVCPPYQVVGGHVFGHVYSGAIGLVNTAYHHGSAAAAGPQSLCVSCNACAVVCPVGIPLPQQILHVRSGIAERHGLPWLHRAALFVWERPRLFGAVARAVSIAELPFRRGSQLRLPLPERWRWRTPPAIATTPARDLLLGRTFEPVPGPWARSGAMGRTVTFFIQCIADRFAPEQAVAGVALLRACGARVKVPRLQHCCGLPALDLGDRATATRMAKATIAALEDCAADDIVTVGASCAIAIGRDHAELFPPGSDWRARAERVGARTRDLLTYLHNVADPPQLAATAARAIAMHRFCQSSNVLGLGAAGAELLARAGIDVVPLDEADVCCGFGGGTSFTHPEVSRGIVARKLENVRRSGARVLVSDNPGCLLHLRGAAHAARDGIAVRHVAEVLAERVAAAANGQLT